MCCETNWDAVIIGAGPCGGAAAGILASRGWKTLLIDKSNWPREKVCGGCLSRAAVENLRRLGFASAIANASPIDSVIWRCGGRKLILPAPGGAAISRGELDAAMVAEAVRRGCEFRPATLAILQQCPPSDPFRKLHLLGPEGEEIIHARMVLVCDGIGGTFLAGESWAKWHVFRGAPIGISTTLGNCGPQFSAGKIYMHVGNGGYIGVVRMADDRAHVAAALNPSAIRPAGGPGELIAQILRSTGQADADKILPARFHGTAALTRYRAILGGHRLLTIGDACGYIEPFTGEGMAWAIAGAEQATALLPEPGALWPSDLPDRWRQVHRQIIRSRQRWCRGMRPMMGNTALAESAIALGCAMPALGNFIARRIARPFHASRQGTNTRTGH